MNGDVVDVEAVAPLALRVEFADGTVGKVRFEPSHLTGVLATLKDPVVFAQAYIEEGAVVWPGDLDLAPDAMTQAIRNQGEWVLRQVQATARRGIATVLIAHYARWAGAAGRFGIELSAIWTPATGVQRNPSQGAKPATSPSGPISVTQPVARAPWWAGSGRCRTPSRGFSGAL